MKKTRLYLLAGAVAFIVGVAVSHVARAEYLTGSALLDLLKQPQNSMGRATGVGYVMGVADAGMGAVNCMPQNIRAGQIADVVAAFIESRPDLHRHSADAFITNMLGRAYPCLPDEKDLVQK